MLLPILLVLLVALSLSSIQLEMSDVMKVYVEELSKLILSYVEPLAPSNDYAVSLLHRAAESGDMSILLNALSLDSDRDGIPDIFEFLIGTSHYLPRSFGYIDRAIYVGRIVVDGFDGDWSINSLCIYNATLSIHGETAFLPVERAMAVTDDRYLYVCLELKSFVYGNTSIVRYIIYAVANGEPVEPDRAAPWGTCVEARFPLIDLLGSQHVKIFVKVMVGGTEASYAVVDVDMSKVGRLGGRCWSKPIEPLWLRMRAVEEDLPFYPLIVFGDNRPPRWTEEIVFTSYTYSMFREIRSLNPVATIGTGDHTGAGTFEQILEFIRATAAIPNLWIVAGNHDWSYTRYANRSAWYRYTVPDLYTRDVGRWRFVFVNGYALDQGMAEKLRAILDESCRDGRYTVLVWHVPITIKSYNYPTDFSYWQMQTLRNLVHEYRDCIKLMLFGHWHVYRDGVYDGIRYIVTGGGGAPLSSASLGKPVYHYVILTLYPNGSFSYVPISIESGSIGIDVVFEKSAVKYVVKNSKRSIFGELVSVPIRIERFVKGIHIEVYTIAPPGREEIVFEVLDKGIRVSVEGATKWFVYVWSRGAVEPKNGEILIELGKDMPRIIDVTRRGSEICVYIENCVGASISLGVDGYSYSSDMHRYGSIYCFDLSTIMGVRSSAALRSGITVYASNGYLVRKNFTVDLNAPRIELAYFYPYTRGTLSFRISVSDESSFTLYIEIDKKLIEKREFEAGKHVEDISIDVSRFGTGRHILEIVAKDIYGNTKRIVREVVVDLYPPKIEAPSALHIESPENVVVVIVGDESPFSVVVKCLNTSLSKVFTDLYGEKRIEIKPISLGVASSGRYVLEVVAKDAAGNIAKKIIALEIGVTTTSRTSAQTTSSTISTTPTSTIGRATSSIPIATSSTTPYTAQSIPIYAIAVAIVLALAVLLLAVKRRH